MYDKSLPQYIIKAQLDDNIIASKIIKLVPEDGILNMTSVTIASYIKESTEDTKTTLELMCNHSVPLMKKIKEGFVCDYLEKDIEYVKRFQRAYSNSISFESW